MIFRGILAEMGYNTPKGGTKHALEQLGIKPSLKINGMFWGKGCGHRIAWDGGKPGYCCVSHHMELSSCCWANIKHFPELLSPDCLLLAEWVPCIWQGFGREKNLKTYRSRHQLWTIFLLKAAAGLVDFLPPKLNATKSRFGIYVWHSYPDRCHPQALFTSFTELSRHTLKWLGASRN